MPRHNLSDQDMLQYLQELRDEESGEEADANVDEAESDDDDDDYEPAESDSESNRVSASDHSQDENDSDASDQLLAQHAPAPRGRGRARTRGTGRGRGRSSAPVRLPIGHQERAADGTVWTVEDTDKNTAGRRSQQNVLRESSGPTAYAKRGIQEDSVASSWRLMISDVMLR